MLGKTLNKQIIMKRLGIVCLLLILAAPLWAFPKYTNRENALRLAQIIDKGQFKDFRIASVFVKNRTDLEYYLQVILDDGSTHAWYMDNIYNWTLTDQLILTNNRALVFPSDESTEFHILDKNEFYKLVLTSKAFNKKYPTHDLLFGKNLMMEIRRFRMLKPGEDDRFTTDKKGHRYRYVLELKNGSREILTYLDAYNLQTNGAFIRETRPEDVILVRSYQVEDIKVVPKQLEDELRNIWRFGIEVQFNQPIPLTEDLFPFQVIEENMRDPDTGERLNRFHVQVLFPNSEKFKEIRQIRTLEYLQHVQIVTDVEHQKRIFLKAQVNPLIFELPPYIEVTGRNSVIVHFFKVTDQSIARREKFVEPSKKIPDVHPAMVPLSRGTAFDNHYLKAVEQIREAQKHPNLNDKINIYLMAMDELHAAAMNTTTDSEIEQALNQRDVLFKILPQMIVENTQIKLRKRDQSFNKDELLGHLAHAEQMVEHRELLKQIQDLRNLLSYKGQ